MSPARPLLSTSSGQRRTVADSWSGSCSKRSKTSTAVSRRLPNCFELPGNSGAGSCRFHRLRRRLGLALASGSLAVPAAGAILLGPYVRFVGPDAATVNWLTTTANSSIVEFGPTNSLGSRVEDPAPATNHSLTLASLKPRTKYYFVIKEVIDGQEISSGSWRCTR